MKKQLLFCCYGLGIGGIEKCMINLLNLIDTERYSIDVLPMNPEYDLLPQLHADVNVLDPFDYVMNTTDTVDALKKRKAGLPAYARYMRFRLVNKWGTKPWGLFSAPDKIYDIAIAYAHTGYVPYYVMDCVKAKKKLMWHHEGRYIKGTWYAADREYFPKWDAIIAVSEDDKQVLLDAFSDLSNVRVLYNILNREEIWEKSGADPDFRFPDGILKLTTVGRLTDQKGPDLLLDIAEKLKEDGMKFCWVWVGDGDKRDFFREEITRRGLESYVIPLGNRTNPYPYMAMCDIYVQPSRYEAYCTTTMEAQVLKKPIIATDVCGMREQFDDGTDGILTKVDVQEIYDRILYLFRNPQEQNRLSMNLQKKMQQDNITLNTYYQLFDNI